jgi:hypothetical protein
MLNGKTELDQERVLDRMSVLPQESWILVWEWQTAQMPYPELRFAEFYGEPKGLTLEYDMLEHGSGLRIFGRGARYYLVIHNGRVVRGYPDPYERMEQIRNEVAAAIKEKDEAVKHPDDEKAEVVTEEFTTPEPTEAVVITVDPAIKEKKDVLEKGQEGSESDDSQETETPGKAGSSGPEPGEDRKEVDK